MSSLLFYLFFDSEIFLPPLTTAAQNDSFSICFRIHSSFGVWPQFITIDWPHLNSRNARRFPFFVCILFSDIQIESNVGRTRNSWFRIRGHFHLNSFSVCVCMKGEGDAEEWTWWGIGEFWNGSRKHLFNIITQTGSGTFCNPILQNTKLVLPTVVCLWKSLFPSNWGWDNKIRGQIALHLVLTFDYHYNK